MCQVKLVQRHDNGNALRFRQVAQQAQKLQLVMDVQKRGGLIEHNDVGFLANGARKQHALALAIADLGEVFVGDFRDVDQIHGLFHHAVIVIRQNA